MKKGLEAGTTEYKEYMSLKQSAEQFHAKGYEARKKGDYHTAIKQYTEAL
jgi:hypothetical protein